jgi:hypothetical protein
MQDSIGSLARHAALAACLIITCAMPAVAQEPLPSSPGSFDFMSRYDFTLSAAGLLVDDDRFSWDTHFGGDFDFFEYVKGRTIFAADYQAILGQEIRAFDPIQGNYTLAAATSVRINRNELLLVLHHVSRHLGDRPKLQAIAWNEIDVRLLRQFAIRGDTLDLRAGVGKVVARAGVDYSWTGELDATWRRITSSRRSLFGRTVFETVGVVGAINDRGQQYGGRLEGGLRLRGRGGALEVFAGFERVIDADAFDLQTRQWLYAGFRLATN